MQVSIEEVLLGKVLSVCFLVQLLFVACRQDVSSSDVQNNGKNADLTLSSGQIVGALVQKPSHEDCRSGLLDGTSSGCSLSPICSGAFVREPRLGSGVFFLTAAHCVSGRQDRLAVYSPSRDQVYDLGSPILHPGWESSGRDRFDAAFVRVEAQDEPSLAGSLSRQSIQLPFVSNITSYLQPNEKTDTQVHYDQKKAKEFGSHPNIILIGFGMENVVFRRSSKTLDNPDDNLRRRLAASAEDGSRLPQSEKEVCELFSDLSESDIITLKGMYPEFQNIEKVVWNEESEVCAFEGKVAKFVPRKEPLIPGQIRQKMLIYLDEDEKGNGTLTQQLSPILITGPHPDTPFESSCAVDSGAPLFLNENSNEVYAVHIRGEAPCQGSLGRSVTVGPFLHKLRTTDLKP